MDRLRLRDATATRLSLASNAHRSSSDNQRPSLGLSTGASQQGQASLQFDQTQALLDCFDNVLSTENE